MLTEVLLLLVVLILTATLIKGGFALTVIYLFVGVYIISLLWTRQSSKNIICERIFEKRVFLGEDITVRLQIRNNGWIPVPWLLVYESLPVELTAGSVIKRVLSLGPHDKKEVVYTLRGYKRGYFPVGPFSSKLGDTLGLAEIREVEKQSDFITVFPHIVSLPKAKLPSRSPLGTMRYHTPIFEDTSRPRGKRDYQASDSLRRVDWKATASTGRLQIKQFEPSIALQTSIILNLNAPDYSSHNHLDATELAIVIAASVANWVIFQKQAVGLATNGKDSHSDSMTVRALHPNKGYPQLVRILEMLARLQITETQPLTKVLNHESPRLPWGATLVIITGSMDEALFDEIFQIQRRGQSVVVMIAGRGGGIKQARQNARKFNVPIYTFPTEKSLADWRQA